MVEAPGVVVVVITKPPEVVVKVVVVLALAMVGKTELGPQEEQVVQVVMVVMAEKVVTM